MPYLIESIDVGQALIFINVLAWFGFVTVIFFLIALFLYAWDLMFTRVVTMAGLTREFVAFMWLKHRDNKVIKPKIQ